MSARRLLLVHNYYRHRGGEDAAVEAQRDLLSAAGWEVGLYSVNSGELAQAPLTERLRRYAQLPWAFSEAKRFRRAVSEGAWPLLHFHNLSPFLGPAVVAAVPKGVKTLMTVHNFRSFCINGLFLRDGLPCEACPQGTAWNGVLHRCHEGKLGQSLALTLAQWSSRYGAKVQERMDRYLFPSRFHLEKHLGYGFPRERSLRVPNFVEDPGASGPSPQGSGLYLGRYSQEKGVETLAKALQAQPVPFVFAGSGPLEAWLREACAGLPGVQVLGWQDAEGVQRLMQAAAYVALPSLCYENQPLVGLQALGHGLPLLVSDLGGLPELGIAGLNGLRAAPGDVSAWAKALQGMHGAGAEQRAQWGQASRRAYLAEHSPAMHLQALEAAYQAAALIIEAVIPVHNRRALTLACLERLSAARALLPGLRATVVDDGSSDGTAEAIRQAQPWVRVLSGDGDLWWSGAMNLGVKAALDGGAEAILSLNDDTEASPSLLQALARAAASKPNAIWSPLAVHSDDGALVHSGFVFKAWKGWTSWHEFKPVPAEPFEVAGLPGACVLIPAAAFRAVGLYAAEALPQYHADVEFCVRAGRAGFPSWVLPGEALKIKRNTRNTDLGRGRFSRADLRYMFGWPQGVFAPKAIFAFYRRTHPQGPVWGFLHAIGVYVKMTVKMALNVSGLSR